MLAYNSYNDFLKKEFPGTKVYKISIDGNYTCPNRDGSKGYGGCTYCNVDSFTPKNARDIKSITEQVHSQKHFQKKADKFLMYFQANTNTYAPVDILKKNFDEALAALPEKTAGLAIGTRADCLSDEVLDLIEEYADKMYVSIEIGLESIYDETLKKINRGHLMEDFFDTLERIGQRNKKRKNKITVCVHCVFGFPWESREEQINYVSVLNDKRIDFVKLHQLHITTGSALGVEYKRNPFELYSLESYTKLLADIIPKLRPGLYIQRLIATSYVEELIAPFWQEEIQKNRNYMNDYFLKNGIKQGSEYKNSQL